MYTTHQTTSQTRNISITFSLSYKPSLDPYVCLISKLKKRSSRRSWVPKMGIVALGWTIAKERTLNNYLTWLVAGFLINNLTVSFVEILGFQLLVKELSKNQMSSATWNLLPWIFLLSNIFILFWDVPEDHSYQDTFGCSANSLII